MCQRPKRAFFISTVPSGNPHKQRLSSPIFAGICLNILKTRFFLLFFGLFTVCSYFQILSAPSSLMIIPQFSPKKKLFPKHGFHTNSPIHYCKQPPPTGIWQRVCPSAISHSSQTSPAQFRTDARFSSQHSSFLQFNQPLIIFTLLPAYKEPHFNFKTVNTCTVKNFL